MRLKSACCVAVALAILSGGAVGAEERRPGPADGFTIHVLAPHQMEDGTVAGPFHHYCKPVQRGLILQCLLFKSAVPDAELIGIEYFVDKYATRYNRPEPPLSATLRAALQQHSWPGNIRELENVLKRFVILQDEALVLRDLQSGDRRSAPGLPRDEVRPEGAPTVSDTFAGAALSEVALPVPASAGNGASHPGGSSPSLGEAARVAMQRAERDLIVPTLRKVHWNRRKAAPLLGVSYKTLLNKIKEHGIVQE